MHHRPRTARRATVALVAALTTAATTLAAPAAYGEERLPRTAGTLANGTASLATSDTVTHVHNAPGQVGISGCFLRTAPLFVTSGLDSVKVFDASDAAHPVEVGSLASVMFENEAMTCGERRTKDGVRRFALIGLDLYQLTGDPAHQNVLEDEVVVVDVTDPTRPQMVSRLETTSGTHTVACIDETDCRFAYTSGGSNGFSVIDLNDIDAPKEIDADPAREGVQPFATAVRGHKWNFDGAGYGIHTGRNGTAVFDVREPSAPRLVTTSGAAGKGTDPAYPGYNDFIHHNSARPNAHAFKEGAPASVANGNVVLVTEEDYEQTDCSLAGSFQSWRVTSLDGRPDALEPLDKVELTDLDPAAPPHYGFCSAHWFDYHPAGLAAVGFYGGGLQIVDVRDPHNLSSYGSAFWGASEVWDAYWVPRYNAPGKRTGKDTHLVYAVDAVRGLDVYSVTMPGADPVEQPALLGAGNPVTTLEWPEQGVPVTLLALGLVVGAALRRRAAARA